MKDALIALAGTIVGAAIGFGLSIWQASIARTRNGRDVFVLTISDMHSKLDELKDSPGVFFEQSLPVLRRAVYSVRPFAKDWPGLQKVWREYESCHQRDARTTELCARIGELEGDRPFTTRLYDYLCKMDNCVA